MRNFLECCFQGIIIIHNSRIKTNYWPKIKDIVGYLGQSYAKKKQNNANRIPAKMALVKELQLTQIANL
jgi:predicted membrane protein